MAKEPRRKYNPPLKLDMPFDEALGRLAQTDPKELKDMTEAELQPLELVEDAETGDRFVLFSKPDGVDLQLRFDNEEPWATRKQMADLFGVKPQTIDYHIKNLYADDELVDPGSTTKESLVMGVNRQSYRAQIYNLDVVLAVGGKVNSKQGIMYRRWSRQIDRQYLLKGFVIDAPRLKDPKRNDHLDDLLEEIADIRASEVNVWKRILELISKCSDYHLMNDQDRGNYFAAFQNAMHWAVTSMTAGEIIMDRLDAVKDHAGLTSFPGLAAGKLPRVTDAGTAKNLYGKDEIKRLNMITNLALDFLESQAEQGRLVTVNEYTQKLRDLLTLDGRPLIPRGHKGSVSDTAKRRKASEEIATYKARKKLEMEAKGEQSLGVLMQEARKLVAQKKAAKKSKKK